jgi:hypothetical protein
MTSDNRMTPGLIHEVLDVLERHGYHQHDRQHTGQAIAVIGALTRVYEGTRDAPTSTYPSPPAPHPGPPGPLADPGAVILSAAEVRTVLFALDEAADDKRDRAGTCADCADQSCPACQWRLQGAQAYDHLAAQMTQAAEADRAAAGRQPTPGSAHPARSHPQTAAGKEAGQ